MPPLPFSPRLHLKDVGGEARGLDGQPVQLSLLVTLPQNILLNRVLRHQPVDVHLPGLADAVAPVLSLFKREGTGGSTRQFGYVVSLILYQSGVPVLSDTSRCMCTSQVWPMTPVLGPCRRDGAAGSAWLGSCCYCKRYPPGPPGLQPKTLLSRPKRLSERELSRYGRFFLNPAL